MSDDKLPRWQKAVEGLPPADTRAVVIGYDIANREMARLVTRAEDSEDGPEWWELDGQSFAPDVVYWIALPPPPEGKA